jgi:hypothetical protein
VFLPLSLGGGVGQPESGEDCCSTTLHFFCAFPSLREKVRKQFLFVRTTCEVQVRKVAVVMSTRKARRNQLSQKTRRNRGQEKGWR